MAADRYVYIYIYISALQRVACTVNGDDDDYYYADKGGSGYIISSSPTLFDTVTEAN